ncbi:MAG: CHASE4 domain-containing protein [Dehalococcoidales bacterium]|nr:CHASE4 domain-containing protein [Dehalococcoidales bacterium]
MTLRSKTLLTVGIVFLALIIILYIISQTLLMRSFARLEEQRTRQNVEQALNALSNDLLTLKSLTSDWASWDDTYAFVEDVNQDYIQTNLVDDTFTELRLNLMLFVNSSGQMVHGKAFDLQNEEEMTVPESLLSYLPPGGLLVSHSDPESIVRGIILLPENPMLIVSAPILTSEDEGPVRGALILGRYLDSSEIERLSGQTRLPLTIYRYDRSPAPGDFQTLVPFLSEEIPVLIRPLGKQSVAGYALMRDIYDKPVLLMRVDMPRDIYAQGQDTLAYFILSLLAVGAVLGVTALLFLDRQVLSRLTRLSRGVSSIGTSGDLSVRVPISGKDELSKLGVALNVMVETLERSSNMLKRKNELLDAQTKDLQSKAEELTAQRREVEKANQRKSEFMANMSHELRSPLNVIIGFAELMIDELSGKIDQEQKQCLNDILNSGQHLLSLVNDVLDLSRIESGKVELKSGKVALERLIASLTRTVMPILSPRKQSLDVDVESCLPLVYADEGNLAQVLLNLVDNASKFTPDEGKLKVEAVRVGDWCRVSVIDNGIGIKKEDQERIFEPFIRLEEPLVRERGGTGLGLTVVKQLIEKHGGRVWVESEYGRGSQFNFTLPLTNGDFRNPGEPGSEKEDTDC